METTSILGIDIRELARYVKRVIKGRLFNEDGDLVYQQQDIVTGILVFACGMLLSYMMGSAADIKQNRLVKVLSRYEAYKEEQSKIEASIKSFDLYYFVLFQLERASILIAVMAIAVLYLQDPTQFEPLFVIITLFILLSF